ncbi:acyltransferase [Pseudomonas lundensis]|uniref:acyltransferase family protein n=1 Tax=Serratia proteamaculans TaxID=28151 RepID=UPI0029829C1D|nr:acyltransferase [Serratia proteamaculans]MDW5502411.1 acyltransferase [Serratia proteamaculans]MDW5507468.1 acyltransferase [Pseudomonas lundensis]
MEISINKSNYLKGIAIILMLVHHLFAYPSCISPDITVYHMVDSVNIEMFVGLFGKICVSMFLFLSGYGFSLKKEVTFKYIWGKLKNLYISYWLVLFIFVPIGILYFPGERYSLSPSLFFENLIGIKSTYNSEWWFFKLYVLYVLSLPLLSRLNIYQLLGLLFLAALCGKGLQYVSWAPEVVIEYCTWLLPFGFGMVFGRSQKMPPDSWMVKLITTLSRTHPLILLMVTVAVFIVAHNPGLLLVTPLFIIAMMKTADGLGSTVNRVVGELGKHSMYMWLTHSFYCYYFTQELIFAPRYTPLILLLLIAVSYLTSLVLSRIELVIKGRVRT